VSSNVISSTSDNLNRSYNLKITIKDGQKYQQHNLKYPGTKTVEGVSVCSRYWGHDYCGSQVGFRNLY